MPWREMIQCYYFAHHWPKIGLLWPFQKSSDFLRCQLILLKQSNLGPWRGVKFHFFWPTIFCDVIKLVLTNYVANFYYRIVEVSSTNSVFQLDISNRVLKIRWFYSKSYFILVIYRAWKIRYMRDSSFESRVHCASENIDLTNIKNYKPELITSTSVISIL